MSGPRSELHQALSDVLGTAPGLAVIHSSFAKLAPPARLEPWDALFALGRLVQAGWTVALPAFTFSFCRGTPFHHRDSRSETGVYADWLLDHFPEALRTPHPIYSFVVLGPQARSIAACASTTTFGDDSPFGLFERENAALVMLGCGWKFCTQFHRYEEAAKVPYRYFKEFAGSADFGDGAKPARAAMYVRELAADPVNDFSPAVDRLRAAGRIRVAPLWRGTVEAAATADLAEQCKALLAADRSAFLANGPTVAHILKKHAEAAAQPPLRIAMLGSSNVHMLTAALGDELQSLMPERRLDASEVPYGQLRQALLDPGSALRQSKPQISIFCDRLEDLLAQAVLDAGQPEEIDEIVAEHAALIAGYHEANGGWSIVHRFAALRPGSGDAGGPAAIMNRANAVMEERLKGLEQLVWLDVGAEAAAEPAPAHDARLWYLGRFPYSDAFTRRLARRSAGIVLATQGKTARVLAIDLDNTLWGGVIGEDGLSGVKIGGDYPGNAFAAFQAVLKKMSERGIALAVCSKNDEDLAVKAMDELPGMAIRSADLAAHRINWQPKPVNLAAIADELSLGLESVLFIDDNPVEREAVRRTLPGVKILDLPTDPAGFADALLESPWLAVAAITAEDRSRSQAYRARREIERERLQAVSLEDFYAGLKMKLSLQPLDDRNAARAAQLCQKTNQFNSTTRRYDQRDLRRIVEEGGDVVILGLEDRHSPPENIGLIILKNDDRHPGAGLVDAYMMSCRVLGRGIETSVLHWAVRRAAERGWHRLYGLVIETERNTPVRSIFNDAGFAPCPEPGGWIADTAAPGTISPWLTVIDHTRALAKV